MSEVPLYFCVDSRGDAPLPEQLIGDYHGYYPPHTYRGASVTINRTTLGPCNRPMPRALLVLGGLQFLMSEVPL